MNWNTTNHPISDLRDWNNEKKLEIRPDFQRREVWSKAAKVMLIDTIIRNIPMPKFYLETKVSDDHPTFRVVIDGQQRITAILDYLSGNIKMPDNYEFDDWAGKEFSLLSEDNKRKFLNYELLSIRTKLYVSGRGRNSPAVLPVNQAVCLRSLRIASISSSVGTLTMPT